ncbi:hypothetical protein [Halomonas sp. GD1P12]|uniref:SLOG cluster 4 domain-containing protein n=1 Tax=Halomonas sp. GD1P12 TaxID=2982691 RepID=UPI0021E4F3DE|nr:hypothetical protein [Halomonas sp. GD1P12]UYG00631.1 hypothetical protein OCT39_03485 [Halomonas sp. GD1P12]
MTSQPLIRLSETTRTLVCNDVPLEPRLRPLGSADWPDALRSPLSPREALALLRTRRIPLQCPPVGVIGPRAATSDQLATARHLGAGLAELGIPLLCGGRGGVMEAASEGAASKGGCVIGLLPETDAGYANPWVTLPIASGLGEARNVLIARASVALIAVGGSLGTHTEVAFGRHFDKPVLTFPDAPHAEGVTRVTSVDEALDRAAAALWGIASLP